MVRMINERKKEMELTNEQKQLLEKVLLHLHSFNSALIEQFTKKKDVIPAKMLLHNLKLCEDIEPLIIPYMTSEAKFTLELMKATEDIVILKHVDELLEIVEIEDVIK